MLIWCFSFKPQSSANRINRTEITTLTDYLAYTIMENEYLITICATTSFVKKTKHVIFLKAKRRGEKERRPHI
jgi:hypothetical protein